MLGFVGGKRSCEKKKSSHQKRFHSIKVLKLGDKEKKNGPAWDLKASPKYYYGLNTRYVFWKLAIEIEVTMRNPLYFLFPILLFGCATGSIILTGETRPPIKPENVKLYLDPPEIYETIGLISASSDMGFSEQGSVDYAIQELKIQAARVGANGVLIITTQDSTSTAVVQGKYPYIVSSTTKTISGRAIFVEPTNLEN